MQVWGRRSEGSRQMVLAFVLSSVLAMVGCSTGSSASSGDNVTATPTFKPGAGTYNAAQTVTIADTTPGAVLYCTTDGTTPTTSSPQCSQPTTVYKTEFLQAIAVAPGKAQGAVASAAYTINYNAAATPTFSPAGGTYIGAQKVAISDGTSGANIYYTLDGTVPTTGSTLYTGPITIVQGATLSAIAVASGYANSGVMSARYVISSGTQTPVISPAGGTFSGAQNVTITDATPGATIYYTVDGSTPTPSSTVYSSPITVSANATVSAIAIASGVSSTVATATFVISLSAAAAPSFSPAAGTYPSVQQVTLSSATQGATIYYTGDGSAPTTSSPQYTGTPISVAATETIKAIATAPGYTTSAVSSSAYTITNTTASPTFSPAAGTYTSAPQVTLSSATPSATIYYTTDGSTPTTSSPQYAGTPISVSTTETINAIAVAGGNTSTVASATYTINAGSGYSGKVMSGTQPLEGASVQMYVAGDGGYGSSATPVSSAAVTTVADGSFTLTYNCPAAPGDLVYVVATGGHTGSSVGSNAGLAFIAALGSCNGALPNPLVVNEVTTVASAYALAQFMTGAANVGSSLANYQQGTNTAPGLAHAFATVTNLVDLTTGQARDHTPAYPGNLSSGNDPNILNNSTVPQARINTLADILSACAADNSKCSNLFSAATPPSGTAPADTLQAVLAIAQNPGNRVSAVYDVASGSGPFVPMLSAAPNDWTLALTFTGGGLGFARSAPITALQSPTPFTNGVFENTSLAIDATGNLWITGFAVRATNTSLSSFYDLFSGMVAKFDNLGNPLTPASSLAADGTPTYGGFVAINHLNGDGEIDNAGTIAPRSVAIDPSGNAWVTGGSKLNLIPFAVSGGAMTEITPALSVAIPWINLGVSLSNAPIAIDGIGNVWTFDVTLQKFDSTGASVFSNDGTTTPGNALGYASASLSPLVFDANATSLWASGYGGGHFFQISPADGSGLADYSALNNDGVFTNIVADNSGNIYGCRLTPGQELDVFNASNTNSSTASYAISTGRGCGQQMVMDGAGHLFTITGSSGSTITPGIIDEFSVTSSGITAITPTGGYTGTGSSETPTINGDPAPPRFPSSVFPVKNGGIAGAAIDGSGNLWVLNVDTGTAAFKGNVLVEFVGIAAPVVTPNSLALQYGQVGVRP